MFKIIRNTLIILFTLFSVNSFSQSNYYNKGGNNNTVRYIDWQLSNDGCWGCASFYWSVQRTWVGSTYQYDIWFSSNSTYPNGQSCSTYLSGIYVYVNGRLLNKEPAWIMFKDSYSNAATSFTIIDPNPVILLTWEDATIY